jgi:hypothetical protein
MLIAFLGLFGGISSIFFYNKMTVDGDQFDQAIASNADQMMEEGRETFRHDTVGDEALSFSASGV